MFQTMKAVLNTQKGQGMVEYGMILALISIAAIAVLNQFAAPLTAVFQAALTAIQ